MTQAETLYAWLWRTFGARPFSVGEFEVTFPSPRPHRALSDLKIKGFVERVGRGNYRTVPPTQWASQRASLTVAEVERALAAAPWPYAFTGGSAVRVWTSGRYSAGSTPGYHPVEVAVRSREAPRWKAFLRANGIAVRESGKGRTAAGVEVTLHRRAKLAPARFEGQPVDPKREVLAFVARNASVFAPAKEMIKHA